MSTRNDDDVERQLSEELVETVQAKLIAKVATFLLINAAAMIAMIATGIAAYYQVDKKADIAVAKDEATNRRIDINSARIERLTDEMRDSQNTIIQQNNNLANYLREHDRNTTKNR